MVKKLAQARFVGGDDISIQITIDAATSASIAGSELQVVIENYNGSNLATYRTLDDSITKTLDTASQIQASFVIPKELTQGFDEDKTLNYYVRMIMPNGYRCTPTDGVGAFRVMKNPDL